MTRDPVPDRGHEIRATGTSGPEPRVCHVSWGRLPADIRRMRRISDETGWSAGGLVAANCHGLWIRSLGGGVLLALLNR